MITLTDLPLELLMIIVDYDLGLKYSPNILASVNRGLSRILPRKIRGICLSNDSERNSNEKRTKLLGMIESTYHQLSLMYSKIESISDLSFLTELGGVHTLSALDHSSSTLTVSVLESFKSFKVRSLRLFDPDVVSFAAIPCLESLTLYDCRRLNITKLYLPAFTLLQTLKLFNCSTVDDVSSLKEIHDITLFNCPNIEDISCLNNNYRVSIALCSKIITYSKSFRYTHSLWIMEDPRDMVISLGECLKLRSLSISCPTRSISNTPISSLLFLALHYISHFKALPPNRLQMVSIIGCCDFNSLDNMNHIRSIHLQDLDNITTLTGLGPKNQNITLTKMKNLEDISSLQQSNAVYIYYCPLIKVFPTIVNSLTSVKKLKIFEGDDSLMLSFLFSLKQLDVLGSLKVLDIFLKTNADPLTEEESDLLTSLLLENFKNIDKVVLHGSNDNKLMKEEIRKEFIVIISEELMKTIFLRKKVITAY